MTGDEDDDITATDLWRDRQGAEGARPKAGSGPNLSGKRTER